MLDINPAIKIILTARSAASWMKSSQSFVGGKLRPDCYPVYADYRVNNSIAMLKPGIVIAPSTPFKRYTSNFLSYSLMLRNAKLAIEFPAG